MAQENRELERRVEEALEQSFPASDPPFFVGAGAQPGLVRKPKPRGEFYETFGRSSFLAIRH